MLHAAQGLLSVLEAALPTYPVTMPTIDEKALFEYAQRCKRTFAEAPMQSPEHNASWAALRDHAREVHDAVKPHLDITFVSENPYPDCDSLRRAVFDEGKLAIWTGCSIHPLWTEEENWIFRVAHDVIPHIIYGRPLTLLGEGYAYYDHLRFCPPAGRVALFTEVIGYACGYYLDGYFPDQQKTPALLGEQADFHARFDATSA